MPYAASSVKCTRVLDKPLPPREVVLFYEVARNITMEVWGFLAPGQYLIHDRDGKYCPAFQHILDAAEVTRVPLPPRSPNLNAYAERWVRSVQDEALSRMILCGEASLQHVLNEYVVHYHFDRLHLGQVIVGQVGRVQRCLGCLITRQGW